MFSLIEKDVSCEYDPNHKIPFISVLFNLCFIIKDKKLDVRQKHFEEHKI